MGEAVREMTNKEKNFLAIVQDRIRGFFWSEFGSNITEDEISIERFFEGDFWIAGRAVTDAAKGKDHRLLHWHVILVDDTDLFIMTYDFPQERMKHYQLKPRKTEPMDMLYDGRYPSLINKEGKQFPKAMIDYALNDENIMNRLVEMNILNREDIRQINDAAVLLDRYHALINSYTDLWNDQMKLKYELEKEKDK